MKQLRQLVWLSAVVSLSFAACGSDEVDPGEVGEGVAVVSFTADPDRVAAGDSVVLSWKTKGAASVNVTGNGVAVDLAGASPAEGTVSVSIDESTSFVLEATGAAGDKATESLTVTVEAAPRPSIESFVADPSTVEEGGTVTLKWQTKHADAVRIVDATGEELDLGDAAPVEGQVETAALGATTSFKLVASRGDDWAERTLTVTVSTKPSDDARVVSFTADQTEIEEGGKVRISWTTENAERVQLFEGLEEIDLEGQPVAAGTVDVFPSRSSTYRLVASKGDQSDEKSLQVKVRGFPSASLSIAPSPIDFGGATTITWMTEDAVEVTITDALGEPLEGGTVEASGSRTIQPASTTTYRLSAVGETGNESHAVATVEVRPAVLTFGFVDDEPAGEGDLVALEWTTGGATSVEISNLSGETKTFAGTQAAAGTASLHVGTSGKFEIVARSGSLEARSEIEVEMIHAPAIASFGPSRGVVSLVDGTASVRLVWTGVTRAETLELDSDTLGRITFEPDDLAAGAKDVEIEADTTFTLTARNAAGFVSETADVRAVPMPAVTSVSTWPDYLGVGEEVELTWTTTDATDVVIEANGMPVAGPHPASGSLSIAVDVATTFEVRAYNEALDYDSAIASVSVGAPQILTFVASDTHAWTNSAITFDWTSRGAGTLTLSSAPGVVEYGTSDREDAIAGSFTTQPLADGVYDYVLEIENASGQKVSQTIRVRVGAGPSIETFTVTPAQLLSGSDVTVQWAASSDPDGNVPSLVLTADVGGPYDLPAAASGSATFNLTEVGAYAFTLTATTEATGSTPASRVENVEVFGSPTVTLVATPTVYDDEIHTGVELAWTSEHADTSLELFVIDGANPPVLLHPVAPADRATGSFMAPAQTANTTYRIVATNGLAMTAQEEVTVKMQGTQVLTFTGQPVEAYPDPAAPPAVEIVSGDDVVVSWTTKRANNVTLSFLSGYGLTSIADPYEDISTLGATLVPLSAMPGRTQGPADEGSGDITFPSTFLFPFGGTDRTQLRVFSNGVATFDMSPLPSSYDTFTNGSLPPSNARINIAPFWDDLLLSDASTNVSWLAGTDSATSEQYLIVQWKDVGFFNQSGVSLNFQVVLHEDGRIDYRYGTMNGGSSNQSRADGNSATIGVHAGSTAHKMLFDTFNVAVPGGLSNKSFRFAPAPSLPLAGSEPWTPAASTSVVTRTATIVASGIGSESKTLDVTVHPRAAVTFQKSQEGDAVRNQAFAMKWTSNHATAVEILDENGTTLCTATAAEVTAKTGTCDVTATVTGMAEYTAVATGALGHTVSATASVNVVSADFGITLFEVSEDEVDYNEPVTLTWETGDADDFEITANGTPLVLPPGTDFNSGSFVVPALSRTTTFELTIGNDQATRTSSQTVTVRTFNLELIPDLTDVAPGQPVTLTWTSTSLTGAPAKIFMGTPMVDVSATSPYEDISAVGTKIIDRVSSGADRWATVDFSAEGFSFPYFGETHSAIRVGNQGTLSFDTSKSGYTYSNRELPSTHADAAGVAFALFWGDIQVASTGASFPDGGVYAHYKPNPGGVASYIIQYHHHRIYGASAGSTDLNFQIELFEDGAFEFRYADMLPLTGNNPVLGGAKTIGYQTPDGSIGSSVHFGGTYTGSPPASTTFPGGLSNKSFRYEPIVGDGSVVVNPKETTDYKICAELDGFTECKTVTVQAEFLLSSFDVSTTEIDRGQSVDFTWLTKNADTFTLKDGSTVIATEATVDKDSGTFQYAPTATGTFTLEVKNNHLNKTLTANKTITVKQFELSLTADTDTAAPGDPVTLTWTSNTFSGDPTVLTTPMSEVTGSAAFSDISADPDVVALIGVGDISTTKRNVDTAIVDQPLTEFPFPFLGVDHTSVRISVDGYLSFSTNTSTTGSNQAIPNTSSSYNKVSLPAFWDDLNARTSGTVYFLATPTEYIVQWSHMSMSSASSTTSEHDLNFQVVLKPDGTFQYRYGTMAGLGGGATSSSCHPTPGSCQNEANGASATIGYQNLAGTAGYQLHFGGTSNSASNFPIGGGLSGRAFQFTPYGGSGSITVNPYDSRSYKICAISGSFVECTESVSVQSEWKIVSFAPSAAVVPVNSPVTLSWQTLNADSLKVYATVGSTTTEVPTTGIDLDVGSVTDVLTGKTTYRLEIESKGRYKSTTVTVDGQTVDVIFSADRYSVLPGEVVTLTYDVTSIAGGTPTIANDLEFMEVNSPYEDIVAAGGATLVPNLGLGASTSSGWGTVDFTPSGFSFPYFGQTYDQIRVGNQGILSFDTGLTGYMYENRDMPSAATTSVAKVAFALFWGDVQTASTSSTFTDGGVYSQFMPGYGPGGIDAYIIQYHHHRIFSSSTTDLNFQLVLYADGTFEYRYGDMLPLTGTNTVLGGAKTVGYQVPGGTAGTSLHYGGAYTGSPSASTTFPGGFTGRSFRYEPLPASGSKSITIDRTTTFEICATEAGYTDCETVTIEVTEAGDVAISEVMVDPAGGPSQQWVEVRNLSTAPIDLAGWKIESSSGSHTILNALVVPPGGFATVAASSSVGFAPDDTWGASMSLDPVADELKLMAGTLVVSSVEWDSTWGILSDGSIALDPSHHVRGRVSHDVADWCIGSGAGSPGALGQGCRFADYDLDPASGKAAIDISAIGVAVPGLDSYLTHGPATLSFPFPFFDGTYTDIAVSSNGFLAMVPSMTSSYSSNTTLPSTSAPASLGIIAPFWEDLSYSRHGGSFRMAEVAVGGQQVAVLQWTALGPWTGSTSTKVTFQAQLWENGDIVFVYQDLVGDTTTTLGSSATVGIQAPGSSGTPPAVLVSYNQAVLRPGMAITMIKK